MTIQTNCSKMKTGVIEMHREKAKIRENSIKSAENAFKNSESGKIQMHGIETTLVRRKRKGELGKEKKKR